MTTERDKFLTEAMGECWHEKVHGNTGPLIWSKCSCGANLVCRDCNPNFSTWTSFGKLWEWAIDQEWWNKFEFSEYAGHNRNDEFGATLKDILQGLINPDRFATAVCEFLKDK